MSEPAESEEMRPLNAQELVAVTGGVALAALGASDIVAVQEVEGRIHKVDAFTIKQGPA